VRIVLYAILLIAVFLSRDSLRRAMVMEKAKHSDASFVLAGVDLAPELMATMVKGYLEDYPGVSVQTLPGGSSHALEALLHSGADVALTLNPPTPREQSLFREGLGDTTLWYPVALGGLAFITAATTPFDTLWTRDLAAFLGGSPQVPFTRLYAPDPNTGLWDALRTRLTVPLESTPANTFFLEHADAVREAVLADPGSIGLGSTLTRQFGSETRTLWVAADSGPGYRPDIASVGTGDYPLYHYLYVVCPRNGNREAAKFVTHLTSARGQRGVERNGYLPAERVPREILLSREPLGATP
jgi:ABC-type phosphate transport system substrate-binding protein